METEKNVLVLQGGGALGAYQAGAFEALFASGRRTEWVVGVSIGAINAALIAGNPPDRRVERLRAFWDLVSSSGGAMPFLTGLIPRGFANELSASATMAQGVPGFFSPRFPPAAMMPAGSIGANSFYDTSPLRETLLELADFDYLNAGPVRLCIGAVNVETGNMTWFDSAKQTITPDHIMASGALPPGFPAVEIDGALYWDGGLVSNTPLQYVYDERSAEDLCIFQVDLFNARGKMPASIWDIDRAFGDLLRSISAHFAHEEHQMRAAAYDQIGVHKHDHERLIDSLRDIMDGERDTSERSARRLTEVLEEWFTGHFSRHDARLHHKLGPHSHE
uniref:patatin-like phospholipase family protein n=1 Tax=Pararhizobium sp. IMCC3301 TaxID=3067904 RepID=UPI002741E421|nr:patatin-like phospholipase family protein [Pararhizobium sp. IMCC3301]